MLLEYGVNSHFDIYRAGVLCIAQSYMTPCLTFLISVKTDPSVSIVVSDRKIVP
jgi:hypothetical protein